jgi:eukaryotic-like serine/threonine-protein kinase
MRAVIDREDCLAFKRLLPWLLVRDSMALKRQGRYQFNDFEVDLARRTLERDGRPIAVSPKTFDLLAFLLLNPQRTVSKSELLRAISSGVHPEESNLSQDIFLLRKAISGVISGEKVIASVQGRGYEFRAPVIKLPDAVEPSRGVPLSLHLSAKEAEAVMHPADPELGRRSLGQQTPDKHARLKPRRQKHDADEVEADSGEAADTGIRAAFRRSRAVRLPVWIGGSAVAVGILALAAWMGWRFSHRPGSGNGAGKDQGSLGLMIADFDNSTGVTDFNLSMRTALTIALGQSPYLHVTSEQKITEALSAIRAEASSENSAAKPQSGAFGLTRQVCERLNDQTYLTGDIHRLGQKFMLTLQAFDCAKGKPMAISRGIAESPDAVVAILDKVAADLRKQLGESSSSIQQFSKPLFTGRAPSLAALKAYADAGAMNRQGKPRDALPLLQRAVELDPKFALAYADLGALHANLGERDEAIASMAKAYDLRDSVDEEDRFFIIATYHALVTGDAQASIRNSKAWAESYPHNPAPFGNLAVLLIQTGKSADALEPARRALELDAGNATSYEVLTRAQMHLGQFEEADNTCKLAIARHLDSEEIHAFLLQIAFLRLDQPAIDEQMDWFRQRRAEAFLQMQQGMMDFAEGKTKSGQVMLARAVDSYRKQGNAAAAKRILETTPRMLAELGLPDSAHSMLGRIPAEAAASEPSVDVPVAWAELGESSRAQAILDRELAAHPSATLTKENNAPQVRAAIALNQHRPDDAIEALEPAAPYDLSGFDLPAMRGRAYLQAKHPELAEAEFHKILDHPGIEPFSPDYALARLGLARALVQQDKLVDASFAYKIVLEIWKEADPDLPRLKEAKAEYAKISATPAAKVSIAPKPAGKPSPKPHKK